MILTNTITRSFLALGLAVTPVFAHADTFTWTFSSPSFTGSGTLTAVAYGSPGEYQITGGSGTLSEIGYSNLAVSIAPCANPAATCTAQNSDGHGLNLTYDNLLFPGNAPGSQLDSNGIILTPGPEGTAAFNLYDGPSQEFYGYADAGHVNSGQNLTVPFNVTPSIAATPEPSTLVLVGTSLLGVYTRFKRRNS